MLIYNHKKEFLGIDEGYLKAFGLSSLAELQNEADDFADLFVKSPGYIHNFKHVHWIDYITCSDTGTESKVIINVKGKNYTTAIEIQTLYLTQNPSQKAYRINLPNIKALTGEQSQKFSANIIQKSVLPETFPQEEPHHTPALAQTTLTQASYDPYEEEDYHAVEEKKLSLDVVMDEEESEYTPEPLFEEKEEIFEEEHPKEKEPNEIVQSDEASPFANYVYNPQTASEELGLPIDLVEEFIQDFIAQANSFKSDLYESAKNAELDNLRIQSHKLKGVAANLRIEDALDALTKINSLEEYAEIKTNLDRLYKIINKLSKTDVSAAEEVAQTQDAKEEEDDFVLSIKEETLAPIAIDDSQVPDSIELPELADDEFFNQRDTTKEQHSDTFEDFAQDIVFEEPSEEPSQESAPDIAFTYDKEQIAHEMGLNIESFNELFDDYLHEAKDLSNSMLEAIKNDNINACKTSATKLRGMSENMRIHNFDDELKAVIDANDALSIKHLAEKIISKLNLISNYRG